MRTDVPRSRVPKGTLSIAAISAILLLSGAARPRSHARRQSPAVAGAAPMALPPAPGRQTPAITKPGYFTEPGVAINSLNPKQVVIAYQDNAHIAYSPDAGHTWQIPEGIAPPAYRVSGDVSVVYDNKGHAILCHMAFDRLGSYNYWGHNSSRNGLYIRRSLDGGQTWEAKEFPVSEQPDEPTVPWEDKPYIVADDSRGPHAGNLYIGWTRWTLTDSEIMFTRSADDGQTWSHPAEIDSGPGLPRDDNGALEGFDGAVGPDSTLYSVWGDGQHIFLTESRDGGASFSRARPVIKTGPFSFTVEAVARSNGFPQIAADPRGGKHGGNLYITWSDYRNGDVDVFCSVSSDHGRTWGKPVRVNDDPLHNGADQFFQWLALDPADGSIYVMFYDRRGDPRNRQAIMVLARSADGGRSFQNYAWSDTPFDGRGEFLGDYTGLAALDGRVYGAWTELLPGAPGRGRNTIIRAGIADFSASK